MTVEQQAIQHDIVLSTLNARYIHSAFGLRYLKANLGQLESHCDILEYTLESRPENVVEQILARQPRVVGFGVYIWNVEQTERVVALLKAVAPDVLLVLGGPEVSYEYATSKIVEHCDYLVTGWGDVSFRKLVEDILAGQLPEEKVIAGIQPKLDEIRMPYHLYTDADIQHRLVYVEASRGCPFKCEFCLSALDKTAWPFDLEQFLQCMDELYERGARHFKFVDRTFNLKVKNSLRVLDFFLQRMSDDLFLHFEVIPDHLPEPLKEMIQRFPSGSLQFEIGIQTFNPEVQNNISRRQDNDKARRNLSWIRDHSNAYIHADLIFGLPGESLESFANSFDQLFALNPHEIQVGILKRLKGSPIVRHTDNFALRFNPNPPFNILSSSTVSFTDVQFVNRFARYWDMLGNSGRFKNTLPLLVNESPYAQFSEITKDLFDRTEQTHRISLLRLFDLVFNCATQSLGKDPDRVLEALRVDFLASGLKSVPACLQGDTLKPLNTYSVNKTNKRNASRQARHR